MALGSPVIAVSDECPVTQKNDALTVLHRLEHPLCLSVNRGICICYFALVETGRFLFLLPVDPDIYLVQMHYRILDQLCLVTVFIEADG